MDARRLDPKTARATCRRFRVKTDYYVNDTASRPEHEASPEYPWCEETHREVGPDDSPVERDLCRPGRACFVSWLPPES